MRTTTIHAPDTGGRVFVTYDPPLTAKEKRQRNDEWQALNDLLEAAVQQAREGRANFDMGAVHSAAGDLHRIALDLMDWSGFGSRYACGDGDD